MNRLLRNLSIHAAVVTALVCFTTLILLIAGMAVVADRNSQSNLSTLSSISDAQLNEINRADSLLNQAMLEMETASNYLMVGQTQQSNAQVAIAGDRIARAEERFERFAATSLSPQGKALGDALTADFRSVLGLVKQ